MLSGAARPDFCITFDKVACLPGLWDSDASPRTNTSALHAVFVAEFAHLSESRQPLPACLHLSALGVRRVSSDRAPQWKNRVRSAGDGRAAPAAAFEIVRRADQAGL